MLKKSLFLSLAAGLLASLAFATPSMAGGSLTATTDVDIIAPAVTTSTDVEILYSSAPSAPTYLGTTTVDPTSYTIAGDKLTINYTPAMGNQELDFTFATSDPTITFTSDQLTGVSGLPPGDFAGLLVSVTVSAVPEPSTMALLGIGMTGFLAFRRFFKRASIG